MLKPFLIVPVLALLATPAFFAQDAPTSETTPITDPSKIPAEYLTKANPVKATTESQARVKKVYGWDCAMCHGDNGDGKGDVAEEQKLTIRDYRDPSSLKGLSDGQIFYIIQNGMGKMPAEGPRAKPDEIWNLVIYLRRMANPQATAAVKPPE